MELSTPPWTPGCGTRKCWPQAPACWSSVQVDLFILAVVWPTSLSFLGLCCAFGLHCGHANECVFISLISYIFVCICVVHGTLSDVQGYFFYILFFILLLFHLFNALNQMNELLDEEYNNVYTERVRPACQMAVGVIVEARCVAHLSNSHDAPLINPSDILAFQDPQRSLQAQLKHSAVQETL